MQPQPLEDYDELQGQIDAAELQLNQKGTMEAWFIFRNLINQRSPERILRMEIEKGLTTHNVMSRYVTTR